MTVSRAGRICIADTGNSRAVVLSEQLELLGTYGVPGEGPGELRDPTSCAVSANGNVVVLEAVLGRVTEYSPDENQVAVVRRIAPTPRSSLVTARGDVVSITGRLQGVRRENLFTGLVAEASLGSLPEGCFEGQDNWRSHINFGTFGMTDDARTGVYRLKLACEDNESVPLAFFDFSVGEGHFVRVNAFEDGPRATPAAPGRGTTRRVIATGTVAAGAAVTYLILAETQGRHFAGRTVTGMQLFQKGRRTPARRYLYSNDDDPIGSRSVAVVLPDGSLLVLDLDLEIFYRYSGASLLDPQAPAIGGAME